MEIKLINHTEHESLGMFTPTKSHENDAAYDVFAYEHKVVQPHTVEKIPLGFGVEVPPGFMACILPRSGWASRGILPQMPPIDSGYTGQVHAIVLNATDNPVEISFGTKVGQMVFMPIYHFTLTEKTSKTRGDAGFGSTGF